MFVFTRHVCVSPCNKLLHSSSEGGGYTEEDTATTTSHNVTDSRHCLCDNKGGMDDLQASLNIELR